MPASGMSFFRHPLIPAAVLSAAWLVAGAQVAVAQPVTGPLTTKQLVAAASAAGSRLANGTSAASAISGTPAAETRRGQEVRIAAGTLRPSALQSPSRDCPALSGEMTSPASQGQSSSAFQLSAELSGGCQAGAGSPRSYSDVRFEYRTGTTGAFSAIPEQAIAKTVAAGGSAVASPSLTWAAAGMTGSGVLQIEAVFSDSTGDTYTTSPVTVTLDRLGIGNRFATTAAGPAQVGLQSGDLSYTATDVSEAAGPGVTRTYNSLDTGRSVLGEGWTFSLAVAGQATAWTGITDRGSYVLLTAADGSTEDFAGSGTAGSFTGLGQAGAEGLRLTRSAAGFTLTGAGGDVITFTAAGSAHPASYLPASVSVPGTNKTFRYSYDKQGDPVLLVAADDGVAASACQSAASAAIWAASCQGLALSYDQAGELTRVTSVSRGQRAKVVATYSYTSGRLTAETGAKRTGYGYTAGLLSRVSNGGTTWLAGYGRVPGTPGYGKVTSAGGEDFEYGVPLTDAQGGPADLDAATVATWGQADPPAGATAVFPAVPGPSRWEYGQITYWDADGRTVDTAAYQSGEWAITTTQYDGYGDVTAQLTAADRDQALAAGKESASVAAELTTVSEYVTAADGSRQLADRYGPLSSVVVPGYSRQDIRSHRTYDYDAGAPSSGGPYDLVTSTTTTFSVGAGITGSTNEDPQVTKLLYAVGTDTGGWTSRTPLRTVAGRMAVPVKPAPVVTASPAASSTGEAETVTGAASGAGTVTGSASGDSGLPAGFTLPADTSAAVRAAIAYAVAQLGKPYIWGGTGPAGFDCSGLVMMAYEAAGISLPRTTFEQVQAGAAVASVSELQPGDLLFTAGSDGTATDPGHVGMYLGDGLVIQAASTGLPIMTTPLAGYWQDSTVAIRRIVS
jgi:cell wall-associated NlpC family hydrolase